MNNQMKILMYEKTNKKKHRLSKPTKIYLCHRKKSVFELKKVQTEMCILQSVYHKSGNTHITTK